MTKSRGCGYKSEEKDCDQTDRDGTDFDDGICACNDKDNCNKYVADKTGNAAAGPGAKRLKCYKTDNSQETCTTSQDACLTERKGLENFRCCQTDSTFDTEV